MSYKTLAIKIIATLGIPLFPLGARLYLSHSGGAPREAARGGGAEEAAFEPGTAGEPAELGGPFRCDGPERPGAGAPPPVSPEALARAFGPPGRAAVREQRPEEDGGAGVPARPVPGEGKFSYLGSIRESNDQEWLYIKEETTGRIISISAGAVSADEERWVVEIEGTAYFIRRK
jgi:hypothetical protein